MKVEALKVVTAAALILSSMGIQLDIFPGEVRCIGEELPESSSAKFSFRQVPNKGDNVGLPSRGMRVQISSPTEGHIYRDQLQLDAEKSYQHYAKEAGLYRICFVSNLKSVQRIEVDVRRLFDNENFVKSIKMDELQPLELLLSRAEDAAKAINLEMDAAIVREANLKQSSVNMEFSINAFSVFSIVVLLSLSVWQTIFLRKFFKSKKLL